MFGSTDLNVAIAAVWKFDWNVEPLALIVPLALPLAPPLAVGELLPPPAVAGVEDVVDEFEEHAASSAIATIAPPAVMTGFLPRSCITNISS
jgi:hypothetical protein